MPHPELLSVTLSKSKISNQTGHTLCVATLLFDIPVVEYRVNLLGTAPTTGTIVHLNTKSVAELKKSTVAQVKLRTVRDIRRFEANTPLTAEIDYTELSSEGDNRLNVYGLSEDGIWTPYNDIH